MIKKISVATGVFAVSAFAAATMTFAQTTTTTTTNKTTLAPTTAVQSAMPVKPPATGRAN